jgi:hypothetical protein
MLNLASKLASCLALITFTAAPVFSQNLVINEFMASNSATVMDEDGDFSDWIELYNPGAEPVNLAGWGLSDDPEFPFRWVFPEVVVQPGEYLLVWASGKDRTSISTATMEMTLVEPGAAWNYLDNGSNQETLWRYLGFDDSGWASGPAPLGYTTGSQQNYVTTTLSYGPSSSNKYVTTYFRRYFELSGTANFQSLSLSLWIDDGAVVYLNGTELVRERMPAGDITYLTHATSAVQQWPSWTSYQVGPDALLEGTNVLAVEVHQINLTSSDLAFNLELKGDIPALSLHTNFSIKSDGEPLQLTRPDGTVADAVGSQMLLENLSYGRSTDGGAVWHVFQGGTPGASNNTLTGYTSFLTSPEFSAAGGFYDAEFSLTLRNADPAASIYYTLAGSEPTTSSAVYTGPLSMRVRHSDQNLIANMETTPAFDPAQVQTDFIAQQLLSAITWMPPAGPVEKATVVRAKAVKAGALSSSTETKTYWVDPQIQTRFTLPVVSISTDASNFFNPARDVDSGGIYVRGSQYKNSSPGRPWHSSPANYKENWERSIHAAFYGADGQLWFSQNAGVRIHGGATRALAQKTLRLYARGDYGDGSFSYPIFEDEPHTSYKRLLLRNSGNDWNLTLFRDALSQGVSRHMLCDTQAYRPAVMFLNGEYWGIHNIRERYDKYYLENTYGVNPDNLDLRDGSTMDEGDSAHYNALSSFISNNNMANAANFAYVETQMDTDQFIDYFIGQIFARNTDWPNNNIACWRLRVPYSPDLPYGHDGRWRWLMFDVEHGFGYSSSTGTDYTHNTISTARGHAFFNRLLDNVNFRNRFINRFADQLNTAYLPSRILPMIEQMKARIAPEMPHHLERWHPRFWLDSWDAEIGRLRTFATYRADAVRGHLRSHFSLGGSDQPLTLNVSGATHGYIRINRTDINASTPGVNASAPYPWTGLYYSTVPITLTAVPNEGYWFSHWEQLDGGTYSTEAVITGSVTSPTSFTAVFVPAPQTFLMHYWSFNTSTALMEPVYTVGGAGLNLVPAAATVVTSDIEQGFANENGRIDEPVGGHLRMNYPIGASMVISLPTTGYENNVLRYETRRSGSGAGQQILSYSTDGSTFTELQTINVADADPALQVIDLTGIPGADNNPNFKIRIQFAQGAGGTAGNNRFDNLTLDGAPLAGTNTPPQVTNPIGRRETVEDHPIQIELPQYFSDDGPLSYDIVAEKPAIASASQTGSTLTIHPLQRGETQLQVIASDGVNPPASSTFRVLVYPKAQPLRLGQVRFNYWSANEPEDTYPEHFLFLQGSVPDPGLTDTLEHAYFIPHDDYHADDQTTIGYPYNNTGRTRINGLWDNGISFINTGRDRDLGGALAAVDTIGLDSANVSWLAGTMLANQRPYAIRLQYRIGHSGPFSDVLVEGLPVEYIAQTDYHTQTFGPITLPAELMNEPYVQLLWRYYHLSGTLGTRAQLRLDDIRISGWLDMFEHFSLFADWWLRVDCAPPDYCGLADLTRNGRVDLEDFAVISAIWMESEH